MREWMQAVIAKAGWRFSGAIFGIPGGPLKVAFRALETIRRLSPLREEYVPHRGSQLFMSSGRAEKELGWSPKWTGTDAILDTFAWYTGRSTGSSQKPRAADERPSRELA